MFNRRGFIGALSGLPIAAVAQPRVGIPEVGTPTLPAAVGIDLQQPPQITININGPVFADRDSLAQAIGDGLTRNLQAGKVRT